MQPAFFGKIMDELLENKKISLGAKATYALLHRFSYKTGDINVPVAEVSIRKLQDCLGIDERTLRNYLKELEFKWVKDNLKDMRTKEQVEHEIGYQEWIDQLDEKYLEDTEVEEDEEEDNRGEDIVKMDNSMRRAGRAWDISRREM